MFNEKFDEETISHTTIDEATAESVINDLLETLNGTQSTKVSGEDFIKLLKDKQKGQ